MKNNKKFTQVFFGIALMLSVFLTIKPNEVQASHFAGGTVSWQVVGPDSARFVIINALRLSEFAGVVAVGDIVTDVISATQFYFGDGNSTPALRYRVTHVNATHDWIQGIALQPGDDSKESIDHQYPSADNAGVPWEAVVGNNCCRGLGVGVTSTSYALRTYVEFNSGNNSPTTTQKLLIGLPQSASATFTIPAADPDGGSTFGFRLATSTEAGDAFYGPPAGLSIDAATGVVTWDNTLAIAGAKYSAQFIIEDSNTVAGTVKTSIPVEILMLVCTNDPSIDNDGDGYSTCLGDCDDNDASRNPGATDICGDAIDQDCTGFDAPCPPANDECADATPIDCGESIDGTTTGATNDAGTCIVTTGSGVWYKWTGTGAQVTVTTCGGLTGFDSFLEVLSGSCGALTCEGSNDDDFTCIFGLASSVTFNSVAGTDYYFLVSPLGGFGGGDFTISLNCNHVPEFVAPTPTCGDTLYRGAGLATPLTFTVAASDSDALETVTLDATGVPAGASFSPVLPTGGNPVSSDFSWTPSMADIGSYLITFSATDDAGNVATCEVTVIVYACKAAVNAGADTASFYGYPPQQTITRTVSPTGGPDGVYTYSWSLSRDLMCNVYASNGDESFTGGTCTNNTCPGTGSIPSSDPNPVCSGSNTISAALMAPADVCVTVTDLGGCTASDCFNINAEDVRCFAGNSGPKKVTVCHATGSITNPKVTICIDKKAVQSHLRHNPLDKLGACPGGAKWDEEEAIAEVLGELNLLVYPNPANNVLNVEFGTETSGRYELTLFDNLGRRVISKTGEASVDYNRLTLPVEDLAAGVYYLRLNVGATVSSSRVNISH